MKLDEFTIGQVFEMKPFILTKEEIMSFAKEYDPQYMHIDEEKAEQSRFKGIIASGLQTLNMSFKSWIESGVLGEDVIAGTEINNLKFLKPVYPGDELRVVIEIIDKKNIKQDRGIIIIHVCTYNQTGEKVLELDTSALIKR